MYCAVYRMNSIQYQRIFTFLTLLLVLAIWTALLTGFQMTQFDYSGVFSRAGIPKPRETRPEWCSLVFQSHQNTNSSLVEDLFALTPPNFEQTFKNPCFYDACHQTRNGTIRKLRCLPFFHVLGVDKCGSTDLYSRIVRHPQIFPNNGTLNKETMWWSWRRYGHKLKVETHQKETFLRYLQYFDGLSNKLEHSQRDYSSITGDGTPMDFWDFSGWPQIPQNFGLQDPKVLTPHLMKYFNPYLKFILIFRQPSERLFSDYIFLKLGDPTPKAFHGKVLRAITMFNNCRKNHTVRACLFSRELHVKLPVRLHVGVYSVFLEEWLKVYDTTNFLFLRTEDYSRNIKGTLKTIFSFLGVEELPEEKLKEISDGTRMYKTRRKKKSAAMMSETRRLLDKFYAPFVRHLHALTNDERFLWNDRLS
ncbi:carbohydrate sulfotransferase 15-like [Ostrea edulis]|uniref:carbohydrate sulfotransferase 15-like n=1 Tax=Ostrea edulis TaxID=37623 RepID=UPI002095B51A|nr:carbohydrate sulfotransferase 15-like [Ostrea edulis]